MNRVAAYAVLIAVAFAGLVAISVLVSGSHSLWAWAVVIGLLALCVAAVRSTPAAPVVGPGPMAVAGYPGSSNLTGLGLLGAGCPAR